MRTLILTLGSSLGLEAMPRMLNAWIASQSGKLTMEMPIFRLVSLIIHGCDFRIDYLLGEMIINIEWGAFDNEKRVLPITKFDKRLDEATENVGCQIFEKMISGLYLGELTRYDGFLHDIFRSSHSS